MSNLWYRSRFISPSGDTFADGRFQILEYDLLEGVFDPTKGRIVGDWQCRSGIKSHQGDYWTRGKSPIPPDTEVNVQRQIVLVPFFSAKSDSTAFRIIPDPIECASDPTKVRAEILLHRDAGVGIGTSGCLGIYDYADKPDDPDGSVKFGEVFQFLMETVKPVVGNLLELDVIYG